MPTTRKTGKARMTRTATCHTSPTWKAKLDQSSALISIGHLDGKLVVYVWGETDDVVIETIAPTRKPLWAAP